MDLQIPSALRRLDHDLWTASTPLPLWSGDIGARMTVIRLGASLWVHSPVKLSADLRRELDELGVVRWVIAPSKVHHFFVPDYVAAYPDAAFCAAPGLPEKRKDLKFDHVLEEGWSPPWGTAIDFLLFEGAPYLNEVVFYHPASKTLILTDLAFNVPEDGGQSAKLFHWCVGATGNFGPHRLVRLAMRDRTAALGSIKKILNWDFERVIVSHGNVLEQGGRRQVEQGFSFLAR